MNMIILIIPAFELLAGNEYSKSDCQSLGCVLSIVTLMGLEDW